jgi:CelD/BcsL family acetyltransferase involved in cellulose biosynthesis
MQISICDPLEFGGSEVDKWHRFQSRDLDLQNPFLSPEFTLAVRRARSDIKVAIFEDGNEIVGFLPFTQRRLGPALPVAAGYCDAQAIVHSKDFDWTAVNLGGRSGLLAWSFDHLLGEQAALLRSHRYEAYSSVIDLSGGWDAYRTWALQAHKSYVSGLERKRRRLEREFADVSFTYRDRSKEALRWVVEQKSNQCRRNGWRMVFKPNWVMALIEDLHAMREPALQGVVTTLRVNNEIIAAGFDLQSQSIRALWFPTYDVNYSRHSPGAIWLFALAQALAADGVRRFDLGKGSEAYKGQLANVSLPIAEGWVRHQGMVGRAAVLIEAPNEAMRRLVVRHPGVESQATAAIERLRAAGYRLKAAPQDALRQRPITNTVANDD